MTIKKFDYRKSTKDIFYDKIYPIYPKEFLFGNDYESFKILVEANFILNAQQWDYILEHWNQKETILKVVSKDEKKLAVSVIDEKIKGYINDNNIDTRELLEKIIADCQSLIITDF